MNCGAVDNGPLYRVPQAPHSSGRPLLCGRCYYLRQIHILLQLLGTPYETRCSTNTIYQVYNILFQEWLIMEREEELEREANDRSRGCN